MKRSVKPLVFIALMAVIGVMVVYFIKDNPTHADNGIAADKPPVPVETLTVTPGTAHDEVDVVGTLSAKTRTDVKAEYPGVVREVHVKEWSRVKKGDRLLSLDTREPMAMMSKAEAACDMETANLLQAEVALSRAEREYERVVQLNASGLATTQGVDEAGTAMNAAMAQKTAVAARLAAAEQELNQAKLRFSKTVITAPIDGVVAERRINEGDLAKDIPLFTIVDNRVLDLTVTVPSRFLGSMKTGLPLHFKTEAFQGRAFEGRVKYINPVVSEGDRSVKVIAEVLNPTEELKSGLFVKGQIITESRENVVMVPRSVLLNWDMAKKTASILVADHGAARKRIVGVGSTCDDRVEIATGLGLGERVILRGGFNVGDGDRIRMNGGL